MRKFSFGVEMCIGKLANNLEKMETIANELDHSELQECINQQGKLIGKLFKELTGYNLDFSAKTDPNNSQTV